MLRAGAFTMLSAELDYTIEIPDQPCGIQGMERGWGPVVGRRRNESVGSKLSCGSAPAAPPSRGPPPRRVPQVLDFHGPGETLPLVSPAFGVLNLSEPRPFPGSSAVGAFFSVCSRTFQVHALVSLLVVESCGGPGPC